MTILFRSLSFAIIAISALCLSSCATDTKTASSTEATTTTAAKMPIDVLPFLDEWKILLGDGTTSKDLANFQKEDYFYVDSDGASDWVVYKTPNSGITSRTSHNTRTELGQKKSWIPEEGGNLTGTLKVMHVSTSGDARVAASYSVVVGQIHSDEGHENEPLKIFYKKFPGHTKGSVFWNYEVNPLGDDNSGRWDFSTAVWGHDMSVVGDAPTSYPEEPQDGIELGEEFSYEINVYKGTMYLTLSSEGHETKTFTKSLIESEYLTKDDLPQQVRELFGQINRDATEKPKAYAGEIQYFKQGAYNQTNGKDPKDNMVWSTGAESYDSNIPTQYAKGLYTEVWFKSGTVGPGKAPN